MEHSTDSDGEMNFSLELGCLSPLCLGVRRDSTPRHPDSSGFVDALLSPWRLPPYATFADWAQLHDELFARFSSSGSPGGVLLMGSIHSIEGVLSSVKRTARQFYWETDLTRCVDRWSSNFLVGAEQGYVGYSPEGTEFTRRLEEMASQSAEWSGGHRVHRPLPVIVFRNIHRACPEVQQMVESLASRGELSLPSGRQISVPRLLVLSTAPGVFPKDRSAEGCRQFISHAVDARQRRHLFDPALASSFAPVFMPSPDLPMLASSVSRALGAAWGASLPEGTFLHRRIVAGPRMVEAAFAAADLNQSDRGWHRAWEKVTRTFPQLLEAHPTAPLPASLATPSRWRVMVELEDDHAWAEFRPVEEIAPLELSLRLPAALAESMGAEVPAREDWSNPDAFEWVSSQVIGQDATVEDVTAKIAHFAAALPRHRPLFSALLLGPTGTGKTMLAGKLAEAYKRQMVRVDCASLQDEGALQDAIFGYHPESLASQVAVNPASLVLLDEVEKAHPSVWFMLMQALDEGILHSPNGRPDIALRKCVVVATSNQLSDLLGDLGSRFREKSHAEADSAIRAALRMSGLVNEAVLERLDAAYLMAPLSAEHSPVLWGKILREDFGLAAPEDVLAHLAAQHDEIAASRGARAIRRACLEIQSRPHEWGVEISEGTLHLRHPFTPVSRRARFWGHSADLPQVFLSSATHPWAAAALQELFVLNSAKTHPSTPQAIVLASGPSGSGKSHMALELSRGLGKGEAEVIDCSSMSEEELSSHIFGRPGSPGRLSSSLLSRPDAVVLFDRVEAVSQALMQRVISSIHSGGYRDGATGEHVDTRHGAFFLAAETNPARMQELCDCAYDPNPASPQQSMDKAAKALEESGLLSRQTTSMVDLVLPMGLPDEQTIRENSRQVILTAAREFGLGPDAASIAESMMDPSVLVSLSTITVRREASRIFSGMVKPASRSYPACQAVNATSKCDAAEAEAESAT
jgi:ATP-dependent Clp protease ATP-binding subunit ClpA